jgi:hypothetical protein
MSSSTKTSLIVPGITLLEFMVASALSLFITELIYTLYSKVVKKVNYAYSKIELIENQRFATLFLLKQIEHAQKVLIENVKIPTNFVPGSDYLTLEQMIKVHKSFNIVPVLYYLGDTHRIKFNRKVYSLYMKKGSSPAEEVIEGVKQINIHYGIKCVNSANICRYSLKKDLKKADQIGALKFELMSAAYSDSVSEDFQHKWLIYICARN